MIEADTAEDAVEAVEAAIVSRNYTPRDARGWTHEGQNDFEEFETTGEVEER